MPVLARRAFYLLLVIGCILFAIVGLPVLLAAIAVVLSVVVCAIVHGHTTRRPGLPANFAASQAGVPEGSIFFGVDTGDCVRKTPDRFGLPECSPTFNDLVHPGITTVPAAANTIVDPDTGLIYAAGSWDRAARCWTIEPVFNAPAGGFTPAQRAQIARMVGTPRANELTSISPGTITAPSRPGPTVVGSLSRLPAHLQSMTRHSGA